MKRVYKVPLWMCIGAFLLAGSPGVPGQKKKPLDQDAYGVWNRIHRHALSRDGQWILLSLGPEEKDSELRVKRLSDDRMVRVGRGESARFSADSRFAVFLIRAFKDSVKQAKRDKKKPEEMPKDSLGVLTLNTGEIARAGRVKSFKMPEESGGWVAYHLEKFVEKKDSTDAEAKGEEGEGKEKKEGEKGVEEGKGEKEQEKEPEEGKVAEKEKEKVEEKGAKAEEKKKDREKKKKKDEGTELVLRNLKTGAESRYSDVTSYRFSEDGKWLVYTASSKDSTADGIYAVSVETGAVDSILTGPGDYKQAALDEAGKQVAFLSNRDDYTADQPSFTLYCWRIGSEAPKALAAEGTKGIPDGWWVSEHGKVSFSKVGKRLFFGTAPRPEPEPEEETPEDEKVVVDIWSWKDSLLQPMQLKRLKKERERSYRTVAHLGKGRVVQLATEEIPDIEIGSEGDGDVAVGISDVPYRKGISWDLRYRDIYIVDVENGNHRRIVEKLSWGADLSPQSKYVTWWDREKMAWFAMDVRGNRPVNLTAQIPYPVHNELHDRPFGPNDHGRAGWTEGEREFIVYDRYDMWATDPIGKRPPRNMTGGMGRADSLRFRYVRLDPDEKAIDPEEPMLLSAFNLHTKARGFYRDRVGGDKPVHLTMMDRAFSDPQKAKDAGVLLFRRSSFSEYPDLWISDPDFKDMRRVSEANPQQSDYLWGRAELVAWTSLDGTPLQGLLFKPENFDPDRKYPMMVYFYERMSEHLHRYWTPAPSRTVINFSLYVSQGYLVFVPDISYKIGSPGESALNAVLPGVTGLIDRGFVDGKRVGVQGHSWGGYQVAYLITRTDLFKAAGAGATVSNMVSAYGGIRWGSGLSRMSQYERGQSRIGGSLWEVPMRFIENSPIFRADQIETPLLMLHNNKDGAVPWEQGIELFVALRRLGKPVWLINYNGEEHHLAKYQNKKDWTVRMQQFFDHYLKDAPAPVWMAEGVPALQKGKTLGLEPALPSR